jgi:hypothetical protein
MASTATTTFDVAASPADVLGAIRAVVTDNGHTPGEESPDGRHITFRTKKTMLSWELDAAAAIHPSAVGSHVELTVDTAPGRPKALLDGKKNRKSAEKLADQIRAALA